MLILTVTLRLTEQTAFSYLIIIKSLSPFLTVYPPGFWKFMLPTSICSDWNITHCRNAYLDPNGHLATV